MKILVTGSSGFIGTNLVKYLRKQGYPVRTADIKKGKDLSELSTCLKATKGIDWVIHLAADNGGYFYLKDNWECSINNLIIDEAMIKACQVNKVKHFFYSSSSCVYPIRNPENSYGREKLIIEKEIKKSGLNYSIARLQNVYGPHETIGGIKEKVIPSFCRQILTGSVKVYGDGSQKRSFIYVDDVCEIVLDMIKNKIKKMDVGGHVVKLVDVLYELFSINGKEFMEVEYGQQIVDRVSRFPKNMSKTSLNKGLRRTLKWISTK